MRGTYPPRGSVASGWPFSGMLALSVRGFFTGLRSRDYTRGRLLSSLLALALPMVAGSLAIGVVFQIVDLAFLSQLGEGPLAAVIMVNQTVWQVVTMAMMGMNFATQSLIARAIGAEQEDGAEHFGGQALVMAAIVSALVAGAGFFFPEQLFGLARPDDSFVDLGVSYFQVLAILSFGFIGSIMFRAILVGAGDTVTPLFANLVQVVVALFLEWVLIFGNLGAPALGVVGVALAISIGQWAALAVGLTVLFRGSARVRLRARHLVPDPSALLMILRNAWPPALQMMGMVVTTFAFLRLAGDFGPTVQTAYSIGLRLGMIVPAFSFPLATACATLVGQALGAGNVPRAWRAIGTGVLVHGSVMWTFAAVILVFRRELLGLITADPEVIEVGSEFLVFSSAAFGLMGFNLVAMRALQGAGDFIVPMLISVVGTLGVGIPSAYWLAETMGPTGIWTGSLLGTAFSTLATGAWLATGRWTRVGAAAPARAA
ncbi:MAG: MATE family efflux transporter [Candidatus Binatia bacterium]|nr:MATE family efflux transporter [Candidatus Binatia bacterium]